MVPRPSNSCTYSIIYTYYIYILHIYIYIIILFCLDNHLCRHCKIPMLDDSRNGWELSWMHPRRPWEWWKLPGNMALRCPGNDGTTVVGSLNYWLVVSGVCSSLGLGDIFRTCLQSNPIEAKCIKPILTRFRCICRCEDLPLSYLVTLQIAFFCSVLRKRGFLPFWTQKVLWNGFFQSERFFTL